jgi:hypothetical protein
MGLLVIQALQRLRPMVFLGPMVLQVLKDLKGILVLQALPVRMVLQVYQERAESQAKMAHLVHLVLQVQRVQMVTTDLLEMMVFRDKMGPKVLRAFKVLPGLLAKQGTLANPELLVPQEIRGHQAPMD